MLKSLFSIKNWFQWLFQIWSKSHLKFPLDSIGLTIHFCTWARKGRNFAKKSKKCYFLDFSWKSENILYFSGNLWKSGNYTFLCFWPERCPMHLASRSLPFSGSTRRARGIERVSGRCGAGSVGEIMAAARTRRPPARPLPVPMCLVYNRIT